MSPKLISNFWRCPIFSNIFIRDKKFNVLQNRKKGLIQLSESVKKEIRLMTEKYSSKDVAVFISKKEQISKKLIYDYCINLKK